jgi:hypothetical protein
MNRKPYFIAALVVCLFGGLVIVRCVFVTVMGDSGKTADAASLRKAYRRAGPQFETIYTDAFSQFVPSAGEISWRRTGGRPSVTVTGQVNTTAFRRCMTNHPSIAFVEAGRANGGTEVLFRWIQDVGDTEIITDARADMTSGDFWMLSFFGTYQHGNK